MKWNRKVVLLVIFFFAASVYLSYYPKKKPKKAKTFNILSWNNFFHYESFMVPSLKDLNCKVNNCYVTNNRSAFDEYDAVVIHWWNMNLADLPKKRQGQRIILLNYECPLRVPINTLQKIQHLIDWTISYKLDSDIVSQYGRIKPRTVPYPVSRNEIMEGFDQKKTAAWFITDDCHVSSKRRDIVESLRSLGVEVDEFGRCSAGNNSLFANSTFEGYNFIGKRYKFSFAFENSVCKDYATGAVFEALFHGIVPVVYGGANYKELLPVHSYIDVLNHTSLEDLAKFLKRISSDKTAYAKYHVWRKYYEVLKYECNNDFFCDLCAKLQDPDEPPVKVKRNISSWWSKNDCVSPAYTNGSISISDISRKIKQLYT